MTVGTLAYSRTAIVLQRGNGLPQVPREEDDHVVEGDETGEPAVRIEHGSRRTPCLRMEKATPSMVSSSRAVTRSRLMEICGSRNGFQCLRASVRATRTSCRIS